MSTNAYAVKRAVFDRLKQLTPAGGLLADVQVSYAWPGVPTMSRRCVYGGGVRFEQVADAVDGTDTLKLERAVIGLYVEVVRDADADDVETADVDAEAIGDIIGGIIAREPNLTGGRVQEITGGEGDYQQFSSTVRVVLRYDVTVTSYLKP